MKRSSVIGCLVLALFAFLAATPRAEAGAVYVPIASNQVIDGIRYQTQVWITNTGEDTGTFSTVFIPSIAPGTNRQGIDPIPVNIPPGGTFFLQSTGPDGGRGLYEINAEPDMVVTARLVSVLPSGEERLGAMIPVLSAGDVLQPNETGHLVGVMRDQQTVANLGVVNLSRSENTCTLRAFQINAQQIADTAEVTLNPLTQVQFDDVLSLVGVGSIADSRFAVSCEGDFYAYSTLINEDTGDTAFIAPSTVADGEVQPPETGPPGPGTCPANAECFRVPGTIHIPRPNDLVERVSLPVPQGSYRVVRFELEVTLANWAQGNTSGLHSLFWFVRNRNRDMIAFVATWGPRTNGVLLRHGFNEPQHEKERIVRPLALQPGETYHFTYVYDTDQGQVELVVRQGGANGSIVTRVGGGRPDVNRVTSSPGDLFHIDFGFTGRNPKEPPTLGWVYKNLNVEFIR